MPRTRKQAERRAIGTNDNQAIDPLQITEETRAILRDWKQKMCSRLESVKSEINGIKQELMNIPGDVSDDVDMRRIALESRMIKLETEEKCIESCIKAVYNDISPMQKLTMPDFGSLIASFNAKSRG